MRSKARIKCGIYGIFNLVNKKVYIGQSVNIKGRWKKHRELLRKNMHGIKNQSKYTDHLQHSWNKYKEENFQFEILEECEREQLDEREKYYIILYKSNNPRYGYNKTEGGNEGCIYTEETRKRMSESGKKKEFSEEHRQNLSKSAMGNTNSKDRKLSEIHKQRIGKRHQGNKYFEGKHHSEETKKRMSEDRKGQNFHKGYRGYSDWAKEWVELYDNGNGLSLNKIKEIYNVSSPTISKYIKEYILAHK